MVVFFNNSVEPTASAIKEFNTMFDFQFLVDCPLSIGRSPFELQAFWVLEPSSVFFGIINRRTDAEVSLLTIHILLFPVLDVIDSPLSIGQLTVATSLFFMCFKPSSVFLGRSNHQTDAFSKRQENKIEKAVVLLHRALFGVLISTRQGIQNSACWMQIPSSI
eukprot:scaffold1529_cov86-Cylindrotheca_fusiformis.AAC.12